VQEAAFLGEEGVQGKHKATMKVLNENFKKNEDMNSNLNSRKQEKLGKILPTVIQAQCVIKI